jgi:hypothetical protein
MCFPPRGNSPGKAVGVWPYAPTCSLAGQANCSIVTLEGGLPSSNNPDISEFLKKFRNVELAAESFFYPRVGRGNVLSAEGLGKEGSRGNRGWAILSLSLTGIRRGRRGEGKGATSLIGH